MSEHAVTPSTRRSLEAAGLDPDAVADVVRRALREDLADGVDVTSVATIAADHRASGSLVSRAHGIVCGLPVVACVIDLVCGPDGSFEPVVDDGSRIDRGSTLAEVAGPTIELLTAERTALNLLCHLSGVATLTGRWVTALSGTGARVRDTRKTTPGLRALEKYAVRCGGGVNHRMGLFDMALVKDNHVAAAGGVAEATRRVRALRSDMAVEIEVDSLDGLREAIEAGADEILVDNFTTEMMRAAVAVRDGSAPHVRLEASGGLTLAVAREVAETGVDYVAVGELTHSASVLDIGLDLDPVSAGER